MAYPLPDRSLQGKVAIVTGAGSVGEGIGNGRATSVLLAQDGCNVICVDLQPELAEKTVDIIKKEVKGKAVSMSADVTKEEDCRSIVRKAIESYGRLDILINNVGEWHSVAPGVTNGGQASWVRKVHRWRWTSRLSIRQ
jgi:NAD(P)-dependent dehydrogenase (short-subunit alcohol dehydrogenase family)